MRPISAPAAAILLAVLIAPCAASAADAPPAAAPETAPPSTAADSPVSFAIRRSAGPIVVDGELEDPGWQGADQVDRWFETRPGDNLPSPIGNVGLLTYDDTHFYAAFRFSDPEPEKVRGPYADRDNGFGSADYGGVIVDTRNDHTSAQMFLVNAAGIQYDAMTSDVSDEDSSPDFHWAAATKRTADGWQLEIAIPFASLRYEGSGPQTWNVLLYRNRAREFRYQYFSTRLPRDVNCFICNATPIVGLEGLPSGGHWTVAPYVTGQLTAEPEDGPGTDLETGDGDGDGGVDVKWTPSPDLVVDATINPDFSQIESDVAQIEANERFALFYPEKRPFFLEGVDLLATPMQAVYTRSITSPKWGGRVTGTVGHTGYTALVTEDRGGGLVIIPGAESSELADQDFETMVFVGRLRHFLGESFVSFLATGREIDGGGHNHVYGPDFRWRPNRQHQITGQFLWSDSETPVRPDLADEWDGRELAGHAAKLRYQYADERWDSFVSSTDIDEEFRADNGFVPQVGYREYYGELGRTWRPENFFRRIRLFGIGTYQQDADGKLLYRLASAGAGMDGGLGSLMRYWIESDDVRTSGVLFPRDKFWFTAEFNPVGWVPLIGVSGWIGDEVDFNDVRAGEGGSVQLYSNLRPTDHLELQLRGEHRWLDLAANGEPLLTADVARIKATYTFTPRSFLRLIAQRVETEYETGNYTTELDDERADETLSLLFAYKLNWQTVLFVGLGDSSTLVEDELTGAERYEPAGREIFVKLSYAWLR